MPEPVDSRERLSASEVRAALARYDLGTIEQVRHYPRGSRRAPKVWIRSAHGEFILKRRAPGHDDPHRVAFAHSVQLFLAERGFPVAALVGTRDDNNSLLELDGRTYELFTYVAGRSYDHSLPGARLAGTALGRLHQLLAGHQPRFSPPTGTFHASPGIKTAFSGAPARIAAVEPGPDAAATIRTVKYLYKAYGDAARRVEALGYRAWPSGVIHGDWHPGNLLYRGGRVVAVLDFDSARIEPRSADLANAILQFSMRIGPADSDPRAWPEGLDPGRLQALAVGYHEAAHLPLRPEEIEALPWLIIEALIMESIVPIAATGRFGRLTGSGFLAMVEEKVRWIRPRCDRMAKLIAP
jgi:homoserine kinase type II